MLLNTYKAYFIGNNTIMGIERPMEISMVEMVNIWQDIGRFPILYGGYKFFNPLKLVIKPDNELQIQEGVYNAIFLRLIGDSHPNAYNYGLEVEHFEYIVNFMLENVDEIGGIPFLNGILKGNSSLEKKRMFISNVLANTKEFVVHEVNENASITIIPDIDVVGVNFKNAVTDDRRHRRLASAGIFMFVTQNNEIVYGITTVDEKYLVYQNKIIKNKREIMHLAERIGENLLWLGTSFAGDKEESQRYYRFRSNAWSKLFLEDDVVFMPFLKIKSLVFPEDMPFPDEGRYLRIPINIIPDIEGSIRIEGKPEIGKVPYYLCSVDML